MLRSCEKKQFTQNHRDKFMILNMGHLLSHRPRFAGWKELCVKVYFKIFDVVSFTARSRWVAFCIAFQLRMLCDFQELKTNQKKDQIGICKRSHISRSLQTLTILTAVYLPLDMGITLPLKPFPRSKSPALASLFQAQTCPTLLLPPFLRCPPRPHRTQRFHLMVWQ